MNGYLKDRKISFGNMECPVICKVPQGSKIGPLLWNVYNDDLLCSNEAEGVMRVAFADDLALVVTTKREDELMYRVNNALQETVQWLTSRDMTVAMEKTEAVMMVGRKKYGEIVFNMKGQIITPKKAVKYLGVYIDQGLTFTEYVKQTCAKAEKSQRV